MAAAARYLRHTVTFQLSMPCTVAVALACAKRTKPSRMGSALAEKSGQAWPVVHAGPSSNWKSVLARLAASRWGVHVADAQLSEASRFGR